MKKGCLMPIIFVLAILGGIFTITCLEKIDIGRVGCVYSMSGGVEDEVLTTGYHFVGPTKKVKEFTIGNEQLILSKDEREGSEGDDSFTVATSDDASIAISFQMSYRFTPEKVVETYKKFKGLDGEQIVDQRVKTVLKSKISEITTDYSLMEIYSGNRNEINDKITVYLNDEFTEDYGMEVIDASIIDVHPDAKLKEAIDKRVTALQEKQQAQAEQEKIRVQAETKVIEAEAAAKVKLTQAQAEAEANKILAASITQELIDMGLAEARKEHGWVTITGANTVVKE